MTFLPTNYQTPKTGGQYTKLKDGDSFRLRVISETPIIFWEWWTEDKKPLRVEYTGSLVKTPEGAKEGSKSKLVWAMTVYNYTNSQLEIWCVSQATIRDVLEGYIRDEDFGDPTKYDLKISRTGSSMDDTKYSLAPLMKAENMQPMSKDILKEASQINLNALITNENPFEVSEEAPEKKDTTETKIEDVPF